MLVKLTNASNPHSNLGFIGGDALYTLTRAHPEFSYTLLVRNEERGRQVLASYPSVRLVYGDLNNEDLIAREAAAADIVIRKSWSRRIHGNPRRAFFPLGFLAKLIHLFRLFRYGWFGRRRTVRESDCQGPG